MIMARKRSRMPRGKFLHENFRDVHVINEAGRRELAAAQADVHKEVAKAYGSKKK